MEIEEIKKILPHRYPFLLVDRVIEVGEDEIKGIKNVTINEPFFSGHFPDFPVMPGVLIIEAMAQLGGILVFERLSLKKDVTPVFLGIDKARFKKMVRPGDTLLMHVRVKKLRTTMAWLEATAEVNEERVAEAELLVGVVEK